MSKKININAGGVFSKVMQGIQNCEEFAPDISSYYFNNIDPRALSTNATQNPFDWCLKQECTEEEQELNARHLGNYTKNNPVELSKKFSTLKAVTRKLSLRQELQNEVVKHSNKFDFDEKTIGVHIRLCDMNIHHARDYGILQYSDFENALTSIHDENSKIFLASDNNESIIKMQEKFGSRLYYVPDMLRADRESQDTLRLQEENLGSERLWTESFLEMLLLSKCAKLVCRTSNLANAAILFSDNATQVLRL